MLQILYSSGGLFATKIDIKRPFDIGEDIKIKKNLFNSGLCEVSKKFGQG